jgi:hypothetical protein
MGQPVNGDELLTIPQVAAMHRVATGDVYRAISLGTMRAAYFPRRRPGYFVRRSDAEAAAPMLAELREARMRRQLKRQAALAEAEAAR